MVELIIAGCAVVFLLAFVQLLRRRLNELTLSKSPVAENGAHLVSAHASDPALLGPQSCSAEEYRELAVSSGKYSMASTYRSSRFMSAGPWDDPAIVAARIPFDHVEIQSFVCRGGYGEVFRGTYRDQTVAIKKLLSENRKELAQIETFLSEIKVLSTLDHPRIVTFLGVAWESLSELMAISEFMLGGDLRTLLTQYQDINHPEGFTAGKLKIALHVAHALTYLHSLTPMVLHRDLKSRNILLTPEFDAKVTDFGSSRVREDCTMTASVGSSLWMAPEVMMGKRYDEKADLFSFGVVLSELDRHKLPYAHAVQKDDRLMSETAILQMVSTGALCVKFSDQVPSAMLSLATRCVALDPNDRPNAAEVLYQIQLISRQ